MNCFKRAFIIFGSALVLGTGLHLGQVVGVALAVAGLYMYSRAKKGQGGYKSMTTSLTDFSMCGASWCKPIVASNSDVVILGFCFIHLTFPIARSPLHTEFDCEKSKV
jgi:hypothetical protein